jgi:hypothetical protein
MAKKKWRSFATSLEEAASDVANAVSVAATGSEIGVLELAAEEELKPRPLRRGKRRAKIAPAKKAKKRSRAAAGTGAVRRGTGKKVKAKPRRTKNARLKKPSVKRRVSTASGS